MEWTRGMDSWNGLVIIVETWLAVRNVECNGIMVWAKERILIVGQSPTTILIVCHEDYQ